MPQKALHVVSLDSLAYFLWVGLFVQGAAHTWWLRKRRPELGLVLLALCSALALVMVAAA